MAPVCQSAIGIRTRARCHCRGSDLESVRKHARCRRGLDENWTLMELQDGVAIVTGAASGLGRHIACALAGCGAHVMVADLDADLGEEVVRTVRERGGHASWHRVDVCSDHDVATLVEAARDRGGPQVLVNNAGGWGASDRQFPDAAPAEWSRVLDLNLRAPMLATQRCLEPMQRAGGGVVINVASSAGLGLDAYRSPEYASAKAGLIRFTTTLAALRETTGIRVNCVVPDWIGLERAHREFAQMSAQEQAEAPPLISPEDVCNEIIELARDGTRTGIISILRGGEAPQRLNATHGQ